MDILLNFFIGVVAIAIAVFSVKLVFMWFDAEHLSTMKDYLSEEDFEKYKKTYKSGGGVQGMSGM